MTLTKDFAGKLAVAFVAATMVVSAFAPAARAQSSEDLQKMINDLLAQVAALQASTGQGATSVASGVCPYTWTRDLATGAKGADVMKLQQFLNADTDTRVAAEGAGSVGMETEFFGPATAAAVSKFQVKYRSEVLSPAGLVNPTGYFGPSTRTVLNSKCVAAPVVVVDPEDTDTEDTDTSDVTLGGEADLDTFEINDADDSTIEEGGDDVEVAEITVMFTDGDASISRLDLAFTSSNSNAHAWDAFDTISLWVDGDKVAEEDASSKKDYLGDEDDGIIRFSGLDLVGMEDEEVVITVAATIQNNLDTEELSTWTVTGEAMRYFDADGVATTEDGTLVTSQNASFDIQTAGTDDELQAKSSSNDPDATTLQVEDNSKSDWYTVFVFDLDTKDSISDITLNTIPVSITVSSGTYSTLVDDAKLVIDGVTIDSSTSDLQTGTGATATGVMDFDVDGDVTIDAGDRVEVELMVRFKSLATGNEGVTVTADVDGDDIDAEGSDDLDSTQLSGVVTGETHTLRTTGMDVSKNSATAAVTVQDLATNDYGTYTIEVEVTAFEQDVFISTNPATSIGYTLEDGAGSSSIAGTRSVVLTSSADEGGAGNAFFEINEGETETLTLTVTYTPGVASTASRLVLNNIKFDAAGTVSTADDKTQTTLPSSDYRTSVITMVN